MIGKLYTQSCTSTGECLPSLNLVCSTVNNLCSCPSSMNAGYCDCPANKYYDANTGCRN